MTYQCNISDKIKNIFSKSNINIAFSVPKKNQIAMKNDERKIEMDSESGIYKLTCDCNSIYIGKTYRKFKRRIYEHYHAFLYTLPDKSNFAAHLLQTNHIFSGFTNNFEIIRTVRDKRRILIWEEVEIVKHSIKYTLINEYMPNCNNPLFKLFACFANLYKLTPNKNNIQKIQFNSPRKKSE